MSFREVRMRMLDSLVAVLLGSSLVFGQGSRGTILGRVVDSSGALVVGADVRALNLATNAGASSVTNESGNFEIPYLLPGLFRVTVETPGFKTAVRDRIELRVADRLALDFVLDVGDVAESVTITGETPLLEVSSASLGQVVDRRRLIDLPLSGGNPFVLTRMTPGVINFSAPNHPNLAPAGEQVSDVAVAGTRTRSSEFSIDGSPNMRGDVAAFIPPSDIVAEFKVQTSNYDAGLGHAAGGFINVVLKAGTNEAHGALYNFHNNNTLQGIDFFQRQFLYDPGTGPVTDEKRKSVAPQHVINRFGATFSGPVLLPKLHDGRNRSFFLYGYEGFIRPGTERGTYVRTVPTLKERQGDFSELLALGAQYQVYDPASITAAPGGRTSRRPLAGNIIPASRLDPMAKSLLQYWPEPNAAGSADGRNNYFRPLRSQNEYSSHTLRIDHNFSEKHRVFGRYNWTHQLFASGQVFPNIATGTRRDRYNKAFSFDAVCVFSPRFLVNVRYGFARSPQTYSPNAAGFDVASVGFSKKLVAELDPRALTFPQIAVDQYQQLGDYGSGTYPNYHTISVDLASSRGNHSLRFGGEFRLLREHTYTFSQETPRIEFGNTWTRGPLDNSPAAPIGQGLASYLLGIPTGGRITLNASSAEQSTYTGLYMQDDWKLSAKLTVNAGLRYEYESAPTERFNRSVRGFDFTTPNPIQAAARANYAQSPIPEVPAGEFRVLGGLTFIGASGQPRALWRADRNNFAPRIGLSYALRQSTVIRAGYGVFFVPVGVDRSSVNQSGFTQSTNLTPSLDNGLSFIASLRDPFPDGFQRPLGATGGLSTDAGRGVSFFNEKPLNSYMQRWSLAIQRQLPQRVIVEAMYVGNRGTKLDANRQVDAIPPRYYSTSPVRDQTTIDRMSAQVSNPFYPLLPGTNRSGRTVARSELLRPYPHFSGINFDVPAGYSWYHSLQVRVERRFASGFTLQTNYTWSKFMEATSFQNASDPVPAAVISDQDRPQRFVMSGIWELPFGPGRRLASGVKGAAAHVVGGWQVQGIYQGQSGPALGFGNVILYGSLKDIPLPRGERTVDRWFNTNAGFERDPAKQLAWNLQTMAPRFTGLRAGGHNIWDLSIIKNFRITERFKLQLRNEYLNALNHSHLSTPVTGVTNTLFSRVTSTVGYPRQVYFALKLTF